MFACRGIRNAVTYFWHCSGIRRSLRRRGRRDGFGVSYFTVGSHVEIKGLEGTQEQLGQLFYTCAARRGTIAGTRGKQEIIR